jgi:cation transport regulator
MSYPYTQMTELPENVRKTLPPQARLIYQAAFNSAWNKYKVQLLSLGATSIEDLSHQLAWKAVKQLYEVNGDGEWRPKRL